MLVKCTVTQGEFLKQDFIYLFLERGIGRDRNISVQEKHQSDVSPTPPAGKSDHNTGMCPDREVNLWCFGSQASIQPTELHQPVQGFSHHVPCCDDLSHQGMILGYDFQETEIDSEKVEVVYC